MGYMELEVCDALVLCFACKFTHERDFHGRTRTDPARRDTLRASQFAESLTTRGR
jgi:hypothetical protein